MCVIVFSWRPDVGHGSKQPRLILAANRDEYYYRSTSAIELWGERPDVLAGKDLAAPKSAAGLHGTWMGVTKQGRFAAITNVRSACERHAKPTSRGQLVTQFLAGKASPAEYLLQVQAKSHHYNGFNLLAGKLSGADPQLWWMSNRGEHAPRRLGGGIFGLSNAALDTPWPKLTKSVARMAITLAASESGIPQSERLFELLGDPAIEPDARLPSTGVSLRIERMLSAVFIAGEAYGTRSSQLLFAYADGQINVHERCYERDSSVTNVVKAVDKQWDIVAST
jgi:uncharacterized protein with NRDE domain